MKLPKCLFNLRFLNNETVNLEAGGMEVYSLVDHYAWSYFSSGTVEKTTNLQEYNRYLFYTILLPWFVFCLKRRQALEW